MKYQILVTLHTYPDGTAPSICSHVGMIAQHLGADVHGLTLIPEFPPLYSPLGSLLLDVATLVAAEKAKSRDRAAGLLQQLRVELERRKINFETTEVEGYPATVDSTVVEYAHYHDFVLVGVGADDPASSATAEAVIFGSGKPILIVPLAAPATSMRHVMVAWDGSRVAARAVADAREFLRRAETVTITSVMDEKVLPEKDPGTRLALYLERNEIRAKVSQIQSHGRPIAQVLQGHAEELGAGLLVMGGFGHSRARDFVMGGATAGVIKKISVPILLSH